MRTSPTRPAKPPGHAVEVHRAPRRARRPAREIWSAMPLLEQRLGDHHARQDPGQDQREDRDEDDQQAPHPTQGSRRSGGPRRRARPSGQGAAPLTGPPARASPRRPARRPRRRSASAHASAVAPVVKTSSTSTTRARRAGRARRRPGGRCAGARRRSARAAPAAATRRSSRSSTACPHAAPSSCASAAGPSTPRQRARSPAAGTGTTTAPSAGGGSAASSSAAATRASELEPAVLPGAQQAADVVVEHERRPRGRVGRPPPGAVAAAVDGVHATAGRSARRSAGGCA